MKTRTVHVADAGHALCGARGHALDLRRPADGVVPAGVDCLRCLKGFDRALRGHVHGTRRDMILGLTPRGPDPTEPIRRELVAAINAHPGSREALEAVHGVGNVFDTAELTEAFTVHGFFAPFVSVTRKADGQAGMLTFQHSPRLYFDFVRDDGTR